MGSIDKLDELFRDKGIGQFFILFSFVTCAS